MKYKIIAEVRESYPSLIQTNQIYNDYVSKKSMEDFESALKQLGYDCEFLGGIKELYALYKTQIPLDDIIFINYNYGLPAEYKRVQSPALLEMMGAKYSGSAPFSTLMVNDKHYSKKVLHEADILSAKGYLITNTHEIKQYINNEYLTLPVILKPNMEGSSIGINANNLCYTYQDAQKKANELIRNFSQVIIEEYIPGYECTVWLIGNPNNFLLVKSLLVSIDGQYYLEDKIFTMEDKAKHRKKYDLPTAILSTSIVQMIEDTAKRIFSELEMRDYARIDFRVCNNLIYYIEANALPIFSKTSEIGEISRLYGISYHQICDMIICAVNNRLMTKTN